MRDRDSIHIHRALLPLSWLYGLGVMVRNTLFEWGVLKSRRFDIPIISVGNLTVGGTGKTPHVEYLIRLLQERMRVAVLSRGYKRKTKGYVLATSDSSQKDIGDEPLQMKRKFSNIHVAVDANRCEGITRLVNDEQTKDTKVILLDDAFQHRYVKPGLSILLVDYNRLITRDVLLPAGRLREHAFGKKRAQIIIVTKCPQKLTPLDFRNIQKELNPRPYQTLFFTTFRYGNLRSVYGDDERSIETIEGYNVLLLTGIASPQQMAKDLEPYNLSLVTLPYPDHHHFTPQDEETIERLFRNIPEPRLIITTEKDATRMSCFQKLSEEVKHSIYQLPITVEFLQNQGQSFNEIIYNYVRENSADSSLAQVEDDNKPQDSNHTGLRPRTISFRNN